jgi:hypothetical protein
MLARSILTALLICAVRAEADSPAVVTETALGTEAPVTPGSQVTVPALTPVYLRIDTELSSKKQKNGDRFPIYIDEDVRIGGSVVIPAGSSGEGEVIHAAKSGIGGKAGELLVTARFVRVADREVRLRSFSLGAKGRDRGDAALALSIVAGPLGMFVVGGAMVIPRGTVAGAKTAEEIQLPAVPQPIETTTGGDDEKQTH